MTRQLSAVRALVLPYQQIVGLLHLVVWTGKKPDGPKAVQLGRGYLSSPSSARRVSLKISARCCPRMLGGTLVYSVPLLFGLAESEAQLTFSSPRPCWPA